MGPTFSGVLLVLALLATLPNLAAANSQHDDKQSQKVEAHKNTAAFTEADAARLLSEVQQALEGDNQHRFLKVFDPRRMANFPAFQDQIAEFFEKYEAFRFRYHIAQVSNEDEIGIVLVDVELELTPAGAYVPNSRKTAQLRLVAAPTGKTWKIVDWTPRSILN